MNAIIEALLACLFTYTLTAVGALGVFAIDSYGEGSGTAAVMACAVGLMLSAVMDLLQEALKVSEEAMGTFSWVPIAAGSVIACVVLVVFDWCLVKEDAPPPATTRTVELTPAGPGRAASDDRDDPEAPDTQRLTATHMGRAEPTADEIRKAWLLFFALTVQHIPEALAMGVAFADAEATQEYGTAISVTLAIGLQDIPEGLAAALVLRHVGMSKKKSFLLGQATGLVQPISGVLGALAVMAVKAALPYALAFAGMCMLFVVVKDMLPDCMKGEDRMLPSLLLMAGFTIMTMATILINGLQV